MLSALVSMVTLAALFTVIGVIFSSPLLDAINTDTAIKSAAQQYLDIYIYGLVFLFLYNTCTGAFAALGDSTTPFVFLAISSVSNIILDAVFVIRFEMGVAGVAWATFICQGFASVAAFIALMRGFEALGGCFVQPDVADVAILRRAQEHPEEYPTLSVRVSGWNARFVSLCREWQNMLIDAKR